MKMKTKNIILPVLLFLVFFGVETFVKPSEIILTILVVALALLMFLLHKAKGEIKLFFTGFFLGLFIEVTLGLFVKHQIWTNAEFLPIPLWLPIAWGIGFVIITRLGIKIRGYK